MAVDTRDKRASVLGLGLASLLVVPSPGTITQPDRQQVAYCYRGIAAGAAVSIQGDLVTTENAYFRRSVTTTQSFYRRTVTTEDAER